jgi:hypothetical protein
MPATRSIWGIATVGCLILALSASPALAKKKHKKPALQGPVVTVSATGNVASNDGENSTAVATCPSGTAALGGGFSAPFDGTDELPVFQSYRSAPDSWTAVAIHGDGSAAVTAFAYCRKARRPITDVISTGIVPSGGGMSGGASAACPAGSELIGGGFQSTLGPTPGQVAFALTNMSSSPGVWSISAANNTSGAQTITAHAYCMTGIKRPTILNATSSPVLEEDTNGSATSPACPIPKKPKGKKGKKKKKKQPQLLSGGGYSVPPLTSPPSGIFLESHISGSSWFVTARNLTGPTGPMPITSQAICV